jgi:CheY-like chemotaxis protein
MRILVVDDELDACLMMKHFLTQYGAEVVMAESVDEALERLRSARFDLLISDIGMPEKDGFDLLQAIANLNGGQPLPAIAVTAYARSEDRDRALSAGYQLHLPKPIDPDELIQAVARFNKKEISLS